MSTVLRPQAVTTATKDPVELLLVETENVTLSPGEGSRPWVHGHTDIGHIDTHVDAGHTDIPIHSDDFF